MRKSLDGQGIHNTAVGNGTEAIRALKSKAFDFIIMDINMPEQDGLDAARWIRDERDDYFKKIPIFALTSYGTPEHTAEIINAGMNEHMVKPFEMRKLLQYLLKYFPSP
jgi:CheY-like chemotaxis protein